MPAARDREESPRTKRLKISGCRSAGMPGPVVGHGDHGRIPRSVRRPHQHRGARRGVGAGVGQQVGQHLVQPRRVADRRSTGSSGRSSRQRWSGPATRASETASTTSRVRSTSSADSGRPESSRASSSRSSTRVGHPGRLRTRPGAARARRRRRRPPPARASSAYPRMAASGVRSSWEASATNCRTRVSRRLPGGQRARDVAEHLVQRRADLADLGAGVGVALRDPHRRGPPRRDPAAASRPGGRWPPPGRAGAARAGRSRAPTRTRRRAGRPR